MTQSGHEGRTTSSSRQPAAFSLKSEYIQA
jgi:hypothetical protein